jgi:hypothetical protein
MRQKDISPEAGATLVDQPKGEELEYRIIAINKLNEKKDSLKT